MVEINGKVYRNLQEQVEKNKEDIEDIKEHGTGEHYTAGYGITFDETNEIAIDTEVVATKNDILEYESGDGILITTSGENLRQISVSSDVAMKDDLPIANPTIGELDNPIQLEHLQVGENKYWIPTDTSDLTNDSGFITISDVPSLPHLYQHNIVGMSSDTQDFVLFSFINTTSTAMTFDEVREWLYDNGFTGERNNSLRYLPATGRCSADSFEFDYTPPDLPTTSDYCESVVVGVRATTEEDNEIKVLVSKLKEKDSGTDAYEEDYMSISNSFTDTVVTLC